MLRLFAILLLAMLGLALVQFVFKNKPVYLSPIYTSLQPIYSKATWTRVDTDFSGSTCDAFCNSKKMTCSRNGCEPDKWCQSKGGMMEIETWDSKEGIVCDRKWEGKCDAKIDRYPPNYNFHCCCQ